MQTRPNVKINIVEYDNYYLSVMDFTLFMTNKILSYMMEIHLTDLRNKKPLYLFFADRTIILSHEEGINDDQLKQMKIVGEFNTIIFPTTVEGRPGFVFEFDSNDNFMSYKVKQCRFIRAKERLDRLLFIYSKIILTNEILVMKSVRC
jgi:hypothetical protein